MKKISLLCLALTMVISSHTYAMEIYKGKITQHKEWTTGGAKASYAYNGNSNGHLRQLARMEDENGFLGILAARVSSEFALIGKPLEIRNSYSISFTNQTNTKKFYHYVFSVCATNDNNLSECAYFSNNLELEPGGYFSDSDSRPVLEMNYRQSGKHYVSADIDSLEGDTHRGIANAAGSIVVS